MASQYQDMSTNKRFSLSLKKKFIIQSITCELHFDIHVILAILGLFTVFGLAIFHVKHHYELYYCQSLYPIPKNACDFRTVTIMWAVPVAWVGVVICSAASFLWLFLTRALRVIKAKTMI